MQYLCIKFLCHLVLPDGTLLFLVKSHIEGKKPRLPQAIFPVNEYLDLSLLASQFLQLLPSQAEVYRIKYISERECLLRVELKLNPEDVSEKLSDYELTDKLVQVEEYGEIVKVGLVKGTV